MRTLRLGEVQTVGLAQSAEKGKASVWTCRGSPARSLVPMSPSDKRWWRIKCATSSYRDLWEEEQGRGDQISSLDLYKLQLFNWRKKIYCLVLWSFPWSGRCSESSSVLPGPHVSCTPILGPQGWSKFGFALSGKTSQAVCPSSRRYLTSGGVLSWPSQPLMSKP